MCLWIDAELQVPGTSGKMRIGSNNSLLGARNLGETSKAISRALERLSTGKRVNSPSDGVADYTASLRLDSQIRGYDQAIKNLNQARGMFEVADSALASQVEILNRIQEIAYQGASDLIQSSDRKSLQSELRSLVEEFERIQDTTSFNGIHLLNGSFDPVSVQVGHSVSDHIEIEMPEYDAVSDTPLYGLRSFESGPSLPSVDYGTDSKLIDIDGDGYLDLLRGDRNQNDIYLQRGNGDGSFGAQETVVNHASLSGFGMEDFNGDGNMDLAVTLDASASIAIYMGNGDGSFGFSQTYDLHDRSEGLAIGDIDNDGSLDIVIGDGNLGDISVLLGNGDGRFQGPSSFSVDAGGSAVFPVELADLDGDGNLDLVSGNQNLDTINIQMGNGDGSFAAATTFSRGNPKGFIFEDFNQDGHLDLWSQGYNDYIYLGNGDGSFGSGTNYADDGTDSSDGEVIDFDGDGFLDVLSVNNDDDEIGLRFGRGDGTFDPVITLATNTVPHQIELGDLDGDGVLDIVVTETFSGGGGNVFLQDPKVEVSRLDLDVSDTERARDTTLAVTAMLNEIAEMRASLGSQLGRMEFIQSHSLTMRDSIGQAKSLIEDTDFAIETAELVKQQVLQQAQVAVQSQANVQLQVVLGLLNF